MRALPEIFIQTLTMSNPCFVSQTPTVGLVNNEYQDIFVTYLRGKVCLLDIHSNKDWEEE